MSRSAKPSPDPDPEAYERREAIIQRFEDAWQRGERPAIETYLAGAAAERQGLLLELVHVELELRWKAAEAACVADYLRRYPELATDEAAVVELLVSEYRLRRSHEPALTPDEFAAHCPQHATALLRRLQALANPEASVAETAVHSPAATSAYPDWPAIPGYEILEQLGRGGMGVVYKARQRSLDRIVALKMILGHPEPEVLTRFRTEAEIVARLQHPNVVQIYEIGEHAGQPFLALEYVAGGTLAEKVANTPLPPKEAARVGERLARAVHAAHERGVIHRDLKPANTLLTVDGQPKVTDFGLAKKLDAGPGHTYSGAILGTPSYMAPEQALGSTAAVGPAADVYALGALLYEALTGRPPFKGATVLETLEQVAGREPVPPAQLQPTVPRDLETICLKCLQKDARRRYRSAAALAEDLARFQEGRPILARPVGGLERLARWCQRNPALAAVSGLALLALLSAVGLLLGLLLSQAAAARELQARQGATEEALRQKQQALTTAEENFQESRRQWATLVLDRGLAHCEEGDCRRGLLFLAAALEYATEARDVRLQEYLRASLTAWRRQLVPLKGILAHPKGADLAAFSPDGQTVLTTGKDGTIRLWDVATARPRGAPMRQEGTIRAAVFSPDGKTVVTAGDDQTARLWDAATGAPRGEPLIHPKSVLAAAFSPDGRRLITGCTDHTARLWDAATGRPCGRPLQHEAEVWLVACCRDGKTLLTATANGAYRWDLESLESRGQPLNHTGYCTYAALNPNGQTVLTEGPGRPDLGQKELQLWSLATGKRLGLPQIYSEKAESVCFSPGGQQVFVAHGSVVRLLVTTDGPALAEVLPGIGGVPHHQGQIASLAVSPDGRTLLTASLDGTAQLWDTQTLAPVGESLEHQDFVKAVAFAPDGRTFLTRSADGRVRLWDLAVGQQSEAQLPAAKGLKFDRVLFSPDGRAVLRLCHNTQEAQVYDVPTGKFRGAPLRHEGELRAAAFSPDSRVLLTGSTDRTARLWDATTGKALPSRVKATPLWHDAGVTAVAFTLDGKGLLTASNDGKVRLWDTATGKPLGQPLQHDQPVASVAGSPDGRRVLTGAWSSTARLWDVQTGKLIAMFPDHPIKVVVAFSPDSKTFVAADDDGKVWLREAADGKALCRAMAHEGRVEAVAYSPDGKTVATAWGGVNKNSGGVRLWNAATGAPIGQPLAHRDAVRALAFSPDGRLLLTGSADGTIRLWDVAVARPVGPPLLAAGPLRAKSLALRPGQSKPTEPPEPTEVVSSAGLDEEAKERLGVQAVAFGPDGRTVLSADAGTVIRRWSVPAAVTGEAERVRLWAQVSSGMELDVGGGVVLLEAAAWRERLEALQARGGLPISGPTSTAPLQERRQRLNPPRGTFPSAVRAYGGG
jgi:WD40 repeat protein